MLHFTCQCPRWLAIPFAIWPMFDVCRRSLRSKSLAALKVEQPAAPIGATRAPGRHDDLQLADQVLYGSIAGDAQRRKRVPRSSSGLSLAGGDELTRAMELIILIDVDSPRVSWVGFTNFTFTFYVHLSSLCVWLLSFAFCLYNVIFYMWLIKCSSVAQCSSSPSVLCIAVARRVSPVRRCDGCTILLYCIILLYYTLTMISVGGHFNYLSGASRRRAVYSDVSGGFVASRPLFDAVLGGLHGGTSSPWLWAQDKSVSSP